MENKGTSSPEPLYLTAGFVLVLGAGILTVGNPKLFLWINAHLTPALGNPARFFSLLGESAAMGILLVWGLLRSFRWGLQVGLTWLSGACFSWVFKLWLLKGLARPAEYFSIHPIPLNLVEGVNVHHFNSFPSGHTLTAFSAYFLCLHFFPKMTPLLRVGIFLLAAACGISRIVLVQHWPADVLGGSILGILAGLSGEWITTRIPPKPFLEKSLPKLLGFRRRF